MNFFHFCFRSETGHYETQPGYETTNPEWNKTFIFAEITKEAVSTISGIYDFLYTNTFSRMSPWLFLFSFILYLGKEKPVHCWDESGS